MPRPSGEQFNRFFRQVDAIQELRGAGVAYVGGGSSMVVRRSEHTSGLQTYLVLGEVAAGEQMPPLSDRNPPPSLTAELIGLGLNCTSAVLAWTVVVGSGAAVPVSGGSSAAITVLAWGAAGASSAQCVNSIMRSTDIGINDAQWTTALDSKDWYQWAGTFLDGVSVLGAAGSATATMRTLAALRRASSRSWTAILQGLTRAERKRLTTDIIRMKNQNASNTAIKALIRAGDFPKRFAVDKVTSALFRQLRDAIGATLSFTGSATSGNIKALYVSVYQE